MARHRVKRSADGLRRIEVTVPVADTALIRAAAKAFREGGDEARALRETLAPTVVIAQTGKELVAFLRASPLVGEHLEFERDGSTGRVVELDVDLAAG